MKKWEFNEDLSELQDKFIYHRPTVRNGSCDDLAEFGRWGSSDGRRLYGGPVVSQCRCNGISSWQSHFSELIMEGSEILIFDDLEDALENCPRMVLVLKWIEEFS